jgi:hypothetical protein
MDKTPDIGVANFFKKPWISYCKVHSLYPVLAVLAFSVLFTLEIDFPKYWLFKKFGL